METMYNTIREAFANGQGDVFFTKNGMFLCKSRKDDLSFYFDNGFAFLQHDEVLQMSKEQSRNVAAPKTIIDNLKTMKSEMVKSRPCCDGFYDEFPDAYNQCL